MSLVLLSLAAQLRTLDARAQFVTTEELDAELDAGRLLQALRACGHVKVSASDANNLLLKHCTPAASGLNYAQFEEALMELDAIDYSQKKIEASLKRAVVKLTRCAREVGAGAVLTTAECIALLQKTEYDPAAYETRLVIA